ncbi:MAG: hypothetical protein HZA88_07675 [Verrucomicrobia bacterium]|nr:hypothetical protein [Verrucomicrobiota bacterium]
MSDTGTPFGPFELFEVVADSPLGVVHRAQRSADGRAVEVFRLDSRFASDTCYLKRFQHQAQAAVRVLHPNLVTVVSSGKAGGQYYLATEATDGGTVGALLRSMGSLPELKAVQIIRDCACGLRAAWDAAQLTHGDIGVEKIRLLPNGAVKLAGLALARSDESSRVGDTQALGNALYQMLVNEPRLQPHASLPDLSGKRPDIGPFVGEVIEKMRTKAAWNYASYSHLIEDLDAVLSQRQPPHTEVKLSLGAASAPSAVADAEPTTPAHMRLRRRAAFNWNSRLVWLAGLLIFAAIVWQTWRYFDRTGLLPLPPAPSTPPPPIALVPAEPSPAALGLPTFENITDAAERGRAMAKHLGVGRLQAGYGGMLGVLDDGQMRWSYAFRSSKELSDFHLSDGQHRLQDGTLQLSRAQMAFKCPLVGDMTLAVEGQMTDADPNGPLLALAVAWHQGVGSERTFGFTRTAAELCEIVAGKRVVLASAPFELRPGTPVRYLLTQRGKACVVKIRDGPLLMGTFTQPSEGTLRLISDGCTSAYSLLEITSTVPADRLSQPAP